MSQHTQGKWIPSPGNFVIGEDGKAICQVNYGRDDAECRANRDRIAACVNACDGLDTETLVRGSSLAKIAKAASDELAATRNNQGNVVDQISRLTRQRDELLAALDALANGHTGNGWDVGLGPRLDAARALVAKAKGGAQ